MEKKNKRKQITCNHLETVQINNISVNVSVKHTSIQYNNIELDYGSFDPETLIVRFKNSEVEPPPDWSNTMGFFRIHKEDLVKLTNAFIGMIYGKE